MLGAWHTASGTSGASGRPAKPILAHHLRIGLTGRFFPGQPGILDAFAIAFIPLQGCHVSQPVGGHSRELIQGRPQGFGDEFETVEDTDRGKHVGGVGALLSPRFEQAQPLAALQELVEEELFGAARQQAVPEFAQGRKVEPRIGELETQEILPVDTRRTASAAWRSAKFSRNCRIVTSAKRHGVNPG